MRIATPQKIVLASQRLQLFVKMEKKRLVQLVVVPVKVFVSMGSGPRALRIPAVFLIWEHQRLLWQCLLGLSLPEKILRQEWIVLRRCGMTELVI